MSRTQWTEKSIRILEVVSLDPARIEQCADYLDGEKIDKAFLKALPKIDPDGPGIYTGWHIRNNYVQIKDEVDMAYLARYYDVMLSLFGTSFFNSIEKYMADLTRQQIQVLSNAKFIEPLLIQWCGESVVKQGFNTKEYVLDYLNEVYEANEQAIVAVLEQCDVNPKLFLAAYLTYKNPKKYKAQKKWAEDTISNSINVWFESLTPEQTREMAAEYIRKGRLDDEHTLSKIAGGIHLDSVSEYVSDLLLGLSAVMYKESDVAKRTLKMMFHGAYKQTFNSLVKAMKGEAYRTKPKLIPYDLPFFVKDLGLDPARYIAWLAYTVAEQYKEENRPILETMESDLEAVKRAANLSSRWGGVYLNLLLFKKTKEVEYLTDIEKFFADCYEELMTESGAQTQVVQSCKDYLVGEKPFCEIKDFIRKEMKKVSNYHWRYRDVFGRTHWLKEVSPFYERVVGLFFYVGAYDTVLDIVQLKHNGCNRKELEAFMETLKRCEMALKDRIPFLAEYASGDSAGTLKRLSEEMLREYIETEPSIVVKSIGNSVAAARVFVLSLLFEKDAKAYAPVVAQYLGDSSKAVRDEGVRLLGSYLDGFDLVADLLQHKKQAVRESAVHILSIWNTEAALERLTAAVETEKSDKVKNIIWNVVKLSPATDMAGDINVVDYCKNALKKNRAGSVSWLNFELLPAVRYKDSEDVADADVVKYVAVSYAQNNAMAYNPEAQKITRQLNAPDFAAFVLGILNQWLELGAEAKKKWVLAMAAIHGDDEVVQVLKKKIEEWPQNARGAIACDAIKAVALNGSSMALMLVDNISRKFKFRQVKEAAGAAFGFAASELGVDPEELADKIVPDLGFDQRGEQIFDYGTRTFTVRLSPVLELEVFDGKGKQIKTLPAPGKNDEAEKATEASKAFKQLKKVLKSVVGIQAIRLELALAVNRLWTPEAWNDLFVKNPIMQQFATGLIWGAYSTEDGTTLQSTFRYMEDGTFNTVDETEYTLPQELSIGLVHPVELSAEEVELWKTQLEDYEVKQPFEQINRPVYSASEDDEKAQCVERFGGIMLNDRSLMGKLIKAGWYRGSVQDAGWYYDYYKENKAIGTGVELRFSGAGVGYENDEDATLYDVVFYNAGTVERGSYVYDKVKKENLINPTAVSKRFFSEILLDLERATTSKTGFNENWRKENK